MKLKFLVVLLLIALCYSACKNISEIDSTLNDVSEYMEEYPDSALTVLQKIEPNQLADKKQKARYALLLTIALDKNYIDTTNFNLLQPAIEYYLRKGNATEKLRTYYYMGRICVNAQDEEQAMNYYLLGLSQGENSDDYLTKARLLFSKAQIHNNLYEYEKYCSEMINAASYFKAKCKNSSYFNSLSNAYNGYKLLDDTLSAKKILEELSHSLDSSNIDQVSKFYEMKLSYHVICNKIDSFNVVLNRYTNDVKPNNIKWLSLTNNLIKIGDFNRAIHAIFEYQKYSKVKDERYYAIVSGLYDSLGNHKEALENYKMYIKLSDSADMAIFRANTKFVEEKYALQLQNERERNSKRIVAVCAIMAILLLAAVIKWLHTAMKQNKEKYQRQCELLEYEKENLLELLEKNRHPDSKIREAIEGRLAIINQFFKAHITENYDLDKKAVREMESLFDNKRKFIEDTTLIIKGNNPQFIAHLKQNDLTEQEIHFTCLYIIGLRGVHIGKYLETTNIYNISSGIRKKLGIDEYKTNLDKLLTELYENCMG